MIPKIIHYCWFGGNPLPNSAKKCIDSWKNFFPDYEIKQWNESNYDLNSAPLYVRQAYEKKKWAFVSDYARFDILYKFGGIYFDTDVEVIKSFDDIIQNGSFMGCETDCSTIKGISIAPGLCLGAVAGMPLYKEIIDYYNTISFLNDDGSLNLITVVDYTTSILKNHGLENESGIQQIDGISIYPTEYFCPINELGEKNNFTENTHSIHWYSASWFDEKDSKKRKALIKAAKKDKVIHFPNKIIKSVLGEEKYNKIKSKLK